MSFLSQLLPELLDMLVIVSAHVCHGFCITILNGLNKYGLTRGTIFVSLPSVLAGSHPPPTLHVPVVSWEASRPP